MPIRETLARVAYVAVGARRPRRIAERIKALVERQALGGMLQQLRVDCVVDVGANVGQYARVLRRLGFRGTIVSFEPDPDVFAELQNNLSRDSKWHGYNVALGSEDGELEFNILEQSQVSSFLRPAASLHSRVVRRARVSVYRLDSFLPSIMPDWHTHRMFVKCDTQGFDVEVVRGAEGLYSAIHGLQSEVCVQTLYEGMTRYLDALRFYESLGYVLTDLHLNNRTAAGDALEYDCLMRRMTRE